MTKHRLNVPPPVDRALVEFLNRLYPEQCPNPVDDERTIWMKVGQRQVVRHLLNLLNRQESSA